VKIHALPLPPSPPPPAPVRNTTPSTTPVLPFQQQPAVDAVQATPIRRNSAEARGSSAAQNKASASRVATPLANLSDPDVMQQPYRRGALLDISA